MLIKSFFGLYQAACDLCWIFGGFGMALTIDSQYSMGGKWFFFELALIRNVDAIRLFEVEYTIVAQHGPFFGLSLSPRFFSQ